jgi:hypothetical protein
LFPKLKNKSIKKNNTDSLLVNELLPCKFLNNNFFLKNINKINIRVGKKNLKIFKIFIELSPDSEIKLFGFTLRLARIKNV